MKKSILLIGLGYVVLSIVLHSCKKDDIPTLSTNAVTNITATSASSGGNITSDGGAEVIAKGVCWGLKTNPVTSDSKTNEGKGSGQFVSNLSGLAPGSTYHLRAYASNSVGTAYGADLSFTALGQVPKAITLPASNLSATGSTLNGTVNANHLSTTVSFEYGTTLSYGQTASAAQNPVTGNSDTNVTLELTGLTARTDYHFRVKTVNSLGTVYGNDMIFTTLGQLPTAVTQSACCLRTTGATLNGTVNANYLSTTVTFEYGSTTAYGNIIAAYPSPVTGNNSTNVSASLSGLNPGTMYHFRVKATNSLGSYKGNDVTFTTSSTNIPALTTTPVTSKT